METAAHRLAESLAPFRALQGAGVGIVDIGAREGINPVFQGAAPLLDVVGFEPDAEEARRLSEAAQRTCPFRSLTYLPYALGEADGERLLYLCRKGGVSSFYKPDRGFLDRFPDAARFDVVTTAQVPVRSLDSLRRDPGVAGLPPSAHFLKIDTQGHERSILRGATELLRREVVAVEAEVLFAPLYESQPVFRDIDTFMTGAGFTLFKLRRNEWVRRTCVERPQVSAGQLIFADALYLRDPLHRADGWQPQSPQQLEALILLALLYDLHDFALELIGAPRFAGLLDVEALRRLVQRRGRHLNSFRERLRMVRALWSATDGGRRHAGRWARGDDDFYSVI
jgi:FkbM family methyltransferase